MRRAFRALTTMAPAGPMPRRRRSLFAASSSRRLTRSLSSGAAKPIRWRLVSARRLIRRCEALAAHIRPLDPIDRSSGLVGPINRDRVAALAASRRAPPASCAADSPLRRRQPHYSDLAIETALTLRAVFRLALRQSEGLIGSIMRMLEIDLPVPD